MLGKGLKSISGVNFFLFVKVSLQIYHTRSRKTAFARHYTRFEAVYLILSRFFLIVFLSAFRTPYTQNLSLFHAISSQNSTEI